MRKNRAFALLVMGLAFASGCNGCFGCSTPVDDPNRNLPRECQSIAPLIEAAKLDILLVIDNSNSMAEEQEGVARELVAFIDEVKKGGGVSTDFRVGVITTAIYQHTLVNGVKGYKEYPGQSGRLQAVPESLPDGGLVLGSGSERVLRGEDPLLLEKFQKLVRQGTTGSGQETPFEAVRLALTELTRTPLDRGGNGGFLRDGARLLIIVLTDEDDCSEMKRPSTVTIGDQGNIDYCGDQSNSLTTVADYHQIFTTQLKDSQGRQRDVIWTAIAPVSINNKAAMSFVDNGQVRNIDCPTSNQAGVRHRKMAEMFDAQLQNLDSICKPSYRQTLIDIASLANISQVVEIKNVPDPRMLQVHITRKDETVQTCTLQKGLSNYEAGTDGQPGRLFFGPDCKRRSDDRAIEIKLLCIL